MTRFHPNRLGLFNFWYHSDSVFEFSNGKLFIRGTNGSGKTITTTMAVPVLIDGIKKAARLDPMGSRGRQMIDLLLGEEAISGKKESIGYLYLEYKAGNQFITTGMGLQGFRDSGRLNSWYFIITDGRRIGHQIQLYDEEWINGSFRKVVKDKLIMREALGVNTFFTESQEEYMEEVSRKLFGFPDVKMFKDLVELLLNLRSPKLSRDLKPGVVNDILTKSLPELSEQELTPLTETIDIIDKHEARLLKTNQEIEILSSLNDAYENYNGFMAYTIAREAKLVREKESGLKQQIKKVGEELDKLDSKIEKENEELAQMSSEAAALEQQRQGLKSNSLLEKLEFNEGKHKNAAEALDKFEDDFRRTSGVYKEKKLLLEREIETQQAIMNQIGELLGELSEIDEEIKFGHHVRYAKHLQEQLLNEEYPFLAWSDFFKEHRNELREIKSEIHKLEQLSLKEQEKKESKDQAISTLNKQNETMHQVEQRLGKLRHQYLVDVLLWIDSSSELRVTELEKATLRSYIGQLYQHDENLILLEKWKGMLEEQRIGSLKDRLFTVYKEQEILEGEYRIALQKMEKLVEIKEVFPPLTQAQELQSNELDRLKIPHGHFFELVEFHDHVPLRVRKALEASIVQVGLFHSIIVNTREEEIAKQFAPIAIAKSQKHHNLTDYLSPVSKKGIEAYLVRAVLEGIAVTTHEEGYILEDGVFSGGWSVGSAATVENCYLGSEARKSLRDSLVRELSENIKLYEKSIEEYKQEADELVFAQTMIKTLLLKMPIPSNMKECYDQIKEVETAIAFWRDLYQTCENEYTVATSEYLEFKRRLQVRTRDLNFGLDAQVYEYVLKRCDDYSSVLVELRLEHGKLLSQITAEKGTEELVNVHKNNLEGLAVRMDEERGKIRDAEKAINAIRLQLEQEGLRDISEQLGVINSRLEVLQISITTVNKSVAVAGSEKDQKEEEKKKSLTRMIFIQKLVMAWEKQFLNEKRRGSIPGDWSPEEAEANMKEQYQGLARVDIQQLFYEKYYEAQHELRDYKPNIQKIEGASIGEETDEAWLSLKEKTARFELTFTVDYKPIVPKTLMEARLKQQKHDEQLIEEEEKELYKKVLIDDIGTIVVQRIQNVQDWMVNINEVLGGMTTNIKIQLKWDALSGKNGSLSTKQLIEILSRDSKWIIEDDIRRISDHFRNQIDEARQLAKGDRQLSLKEKIRDIMDYRKWFEFRILSQKGQDKMKPLTDSMFNSYSNGEKAMSIYMPLFAAIAAKYKDAAPSAPRIISLDEAFAGVDSENTAKLFRLAHQLDFDYIMNAFGLWGCYESVDSLSIIEIVRPISSPTMGLVRYHWDGKKRYRFPTGESLDSTRPSEGSME